MQLKSETIVKAYIDRIQEVNPFINAVIEDRFELAINEAKLYDEQLKSGKFTIDILEKEKPLYGVPITIKESCCLSGNDLSDIFNEIITMKCSFFK